MEVVRLDKKGLSNNRNNALDHCTADLVLIADDDLEYYPNFSDVIFETFAEKEENKENDLDLAVFKIDFSPPKHYPSKDCRLKLPLPKNYYCSSVEIVFRREKFKERRFYPEIGLGNDRIQCGEDELFLISALKRNFSCKFINKSIGRHPSETTGQKVSSGILRGNGLIIRLIYPLSSILRLPLKAYRVNRKNKYPFLKALMYLIQGAVSRVPKAYR